MPGMLAKKLGVYRKQVGIQNLQNAGKVNLGVLGIRMIAMNQKRGDSQQQQTR